MIFASMCSGYDVINAVGVSSAVGAFVAVAFEYL